MPWSDPLALKQYHQTNHYDDYVERKDSLFWYLTALFNEKPSQFKALFKEVSSFRNKRSIEVWSSLAGYMHYINGDYRSSRDYFLRAVALNPDNLDNWFDLAFALRHLGENECSEAILFYYELVRYYYKKMPTQACRWKGFKSLLLKVSRAAKRKRL